MPSESIPDEIWSIIFSFCVEKKEGGDYVPQETLTTCLRVNKKWFLLAAPHLYRQPVIRDIGNFLFGADQPAPDDLSSAQTDELNAFPNQSMKPLLLQFTRRITLVPFSIRDDAPQEEERRVIANQTYSYKEACNILRDMLKDQDPVIPIPNLISLSIKFPAPKSLDRHLGVLEALDDDLCPFRLLFMACQSGPTHWCEHEPFFDSPTEMVVDKSRYLPKIIELHTSFESSSGSRLLWGTTNRLAIRREIDARTADWPKWSVSTSVDQPKRLIDETMEVKQCHQHPTCTFAEIEAFQSRLVEVPRIFSEEADIVKFIVDAIKRSRSVDCPDSQGLGASEELDKMSRFEFYGFEKFLDVYSMTEGFVEELDGDSSSSDEPVDMSYWTGYRNSRFNESTLERRAKLQMDALKTIESDVKIEVGIGEDGRWKKDGRIAPQIHFFLAVDHPGCSACGEGRGDRWVLEDSSWADEGGNTGDQQDTESDHDDLGDEGIYSLSD